MYGNIFLLGSTGLVMEISEMSETAMSESPSPEISVAPVIPNPTARPTKEHWGQFGIKQLVAVAGIIAAAAVAYVVGRYKAEQTQSPSPAPVLASATVLVDQKDKAEIESLKRAQADLATKLRQAQTDLASERAKWDSFNRQPVDRRKVKSDNITATSTTGPALAAGPGAHDISQTINQFGQPLRHLTDEDRQTIRDTLPDVPKDAKLSIGAPIGDSEAIAYANEIYRFVQAIGFKNFDINSLTRSAVAYTMVALPSPPRFSFVKQTEGTYEILVHQQR
jgi:hypothetical protein